MNFRDKAVNILERQLTKNAIVLAIRRWSGNTFVEIDLHIPDASFDGNGLVRHMKTRVAPLTFRDYTVANWDAETKTCTLFVDAAHDGAGAAWARSLTKNDSLQYFNIESHRYPVLPGGSHMFLGDQSAIGHFLALQQLTGSYTRISGAIAIDNERHHHELKEYYPFLTLQSVKPVTNATQAIISWLQAHNIPTNQMIYMAGNVHLVSDIRKYLKSKGVPAHQIKAQGFWH